MAAADWEDRAHDLRAAAAGCREDAAEITRLAAALSWSGLSADAFRAAVDLQVHALRLVAQELEVAADVVGAHGRAVQTAESALGLVGSVVEAVLP